MRALFLFLIILVAGCCKEKILREEVIFGESQDKIKETHLQKASSYIGSSSYSLAEKEVKKAIKIDPQDSKLYFILGSIYDKMNENKKAVEAYITGIKLSKKNHEKIGTSSFRNPFEPVWKRTKKPKTKP